MTLNDATTSYTITSLTVGTDYTVSVTASNVVGQSAKQSTIVRTLDVPAQPSAPTVSSFTSTSVTLNWNSVATASSYTIHYNIVGQAESAQAASTGYTLNGLTANSQYEFRISATNTAG